MPQCHGRATISVLIITLIVTSTWLTTPALGGYRLVSGPAPDDPAGVSIYRLDNGLTVYLSENHESPRFYSEIAVRAGHKNDPPDNTGLAHYLEHLLFKGNDRMGTIDIESERPHLDRITELYEERFKETDPAKRDAIYEQINAETQASAAYAVPNEFSSVYKQLGSSGLNAHTWFEETVYKVGLPANRMEQWCQIESDRFVDPSFRLFVTELEVVYEEKNRGMDDKGRVTFEEMIRHLFKHHPYGQQTTLGEVEHLKNPSLKAVRDFYDTYYVPNNMAIIISGDIHPEQTIGLIDRYFSKWQAKPLPEARVYQEQPLDSREQVTVTFDAEPYLLMGYRIPGRNDADADALILVDMVLSNSSTGLIDLNLVQSQEVQSAGSSPFLQNDYGWEIFWATPKQEQTLEEAEALLLDQIEKVKNGEFDKAMLDGIIAKFKIDQKRSLESDTGRVTMIRNSFIAGQDWAYTVDQLDRMSRLTKADVVEAARKYYSGGYVATYRVEGQHEVPPITKPAIDTIPIDPTRQSPYAKQLLEMPVEPIEPAYIEQGRDYTVTHYADGVDLVYTPNPINDLFTLSFVIDKGTLHDKTLNMVGQLINQAGTQRLSPEELKRAWFALGTTMSFGSSSNRTMITLSGLDENLDASLALLTELLSEPSADPQTLKDMVENAINRRQQDKKSHQTIAGAMRELSRYGEMSNFINALSDEQLRALTAEDLLAKAGALLDIKHTIRYTGSLPVERVMDTLRSHHAVADSLEDPPAYVSRPMRVPQTNETRFFDKEMAQTMIYIDTPGVEYDQALQPMADLFNQYFGGMSGIAYQELREARALAYVVGGGYYTASRLNERNSTVGMIGCQADKSNQAMDAMLDLIDGLDISVDRFNKSKEALISVYRTSKIGFRSIAGTVDAWAQLGLNSDPRSAWFKAIQNADTASLNEFYTDEIKGRPKYIIVVGDRNKIDMEELATHGDVIEMTLDDLFGY